MKPWEPRAYFPLAECEQYLKTFVRRLQRRIIIHYRYLAILARLYCRSPLATKKNYRFFLPSNNRNDAYILETARAFHADSQAVEALFIGYGLAVKFRDDLQTMVDEFEGAINAQDTANRDRIDANATVDSIIDQALTARRTLLVIIPNIFRNDPGKLADWASASHIEKLPKAKKAPTP